MDQLLKLGLSEQKAKETLKNVQLTKFITEILAQVFDIFCFSHIFIDDEIRNRRKIFRSEIQKFRKAAVS